MLSHVNMEEVDNHGQKYMKSLLFYLLIKRHPDRNKSPEAGENQKKINIAFDVNYFVNYWHLKKYFVILIFNSSILRKNSNFLKYDHQQKLMKRLIE